MEKYSRVEKPKPESPINENEIRVTTQGLIRNYISYATTLLQEKHATEISLKAMGQAISKTVAIVEILKKRIPGLHQDNAISSLSITDVWEPNEEGLVQLETTRQVSMISITLSTKELNTNSPGYQSPLPYDQQQMYYQQQQSHHKQDSYGRGRGHGRGRGRGRGRGQGQSWERGGYGTYQDNGGYSNWGRGGGRGRDWGYYGGGYQGGRGGGGYQGVRGGGYQRGRGGGYQGGRGGGYQGARSSGDQGGRGGGRGYGRGSRGRGGTEGHSRGGANQA